MSTAKSDLLHELSARGYIHQCTDEAGLDALARKEIITGYIGFDCTAPSLHVGNLVSIMLLRKLQQTGHRPIVLIGGGTTKVGDPSGKDESRKLLDDATIASNIEGIQRVFSKFVTFGTGDRDAILLNNAEWLEKLNYISFLRDYGRHFSVNRMLSQDSVKLRLDREQNLSFIEFNYMVLQAYDFVELHRREGCRLQMGGSDQWGNIVTGIELGRRTDGVELFGVTTPLLTTASGAKMGKTADGAVWLNPDMLSPYDYWQFWRNAEDADVPRFLKLFTELPLDEIDRLAALEGAELNDAKKILATEATALVHGREAADQAAETARATFEQGQLASELPTIEISQAELQNGFGVLTASVQAGFVKSTGEARRQVKGGGLKVNDVPVNDERQVLTPADLTADGVIKLSLGKKRHALIRPV
ncbi:tyrosine--tRNA ligase [Methyloceanibacter caenitepidi]|uniref:Tyrosine--tRNA ligase n=1 Tax=Methyloceanibacter caenitepidi TaxID=1384459 RepID=A0A0A8K2L9_9HYPH|nr:tyrosine--tRNA ligase [Methyloceanibacter caenitepidi]BAQ17203.1 tyrosyl-tRNA synthetase [Methyloceanibacter caenitepidi]